MNTPADFFERCPVCRARLKDSMQCRRCGLDFSTVLNTVGEAERLAVQACCQLKEGRLEEAFADALRATRIHSCPQTLKSLALAALGLGYFDLALALWRQINDEACLKSGKKV